VFEVLKAKQKPPPQTYATPLLYGSKPNPKLPVMTYVEKQPKRLNRFTPKPHIYTNITGWSCKEKNKNGKKDII